MEVNPTPVNDGQVGVESQPVETTATEPENGVQAAPAPQPERQPQSREENAAFAQMRRDMEAARKERDAAKALADQMAAYGWGDRDGIKSAAEWQERMSAAEFQQQLNANPREAIRTAAKELIEQDPELSATREFLRQETARQMNKRHIDELHAEYPELSDTIKSIDDYNKLVPPDKLPEAQALYGQGWTPADIYLKFNRKTIIENAAKRAQQDTIAKITTNAAATPGAVGQGADSPLIITEEQLQNGLDKKRLASDPTYYAAALEANRQRYKKK